MYRQFSFYSTQKIIFGTGALSALGEELYKCGAKKVLIVSDPNLQEIGLVAKVGSLIEDAGIDSALFSVVGQNPVVAVAESCADKVRSNGYDLVIGLGGGSSIDVAKISAMLAKNPGQPKDYFGVDKVTKPGLPTIAIPTTAGSGSEGTNIAILADEKEQLKFGTVSRHIIPNTALVDPALTVTMPAAVTASTGLDAFTHGVEAFVAKKASPISDLYALKAVELAAANLRTTVSDSDNLEARSAMSLAALYGGIAIGSAGVGAAHALAYPLEGSYNIPHGVANGLMLLYTAQYNLPAAIPRFAALAEVMGEIIAGLSQREAAMKAIDCIRNLCIDLEVPVRLKEIDVAADSIEMLTEQAAQIGRITENNPRKLTPASIESIYRSAI